MLGSGPGGPTVVPSDAAREAAAVAEDRLALARRWEQLLEEIRALPGLDGFLRPPSVADLVASAAEGPVVVVNVSAFRCDALVVTADAGIDVVPLPRPRCGTSRRGRRSSSGGWTRRTGNEASTRPSR
ncbi:hypothetical protein SBADM41S_06274 [Streptomyces badius]